MKMRLDGKVQELTYVRHLRTYTPDGGGDNIDTAIWVKEDGTEVRLSTSSGDGRRGWWLAPEELKKIRKAKRIAKMQANPELRYRWRSVSQSQFESRDRKGPWVWLHYSGFGDSRECRRLRPGESLASVVERIQSLGWKVELAHAYRDGEWIESYDAGRYVSAGSQ